MAESGSCRIRFLPSERDVCVPVGTTLLEAARQAGLPVAQACQGAGVCGRCGVSIVSGGQTLPESEGERGAKARNRVDSHLRLSCQVPLAGDLVVSAPYW